MIVGFSINELQAEKGNIKKGNVNVNYTPEIKDVDEAKASAFDEKLLRVSFEFTVSYMQEDTKAGEIKFSGSLLWKGDIEEIKEKWNEDGNLPEKAGKVMTNNLYKRGITQSVGIADSMSLPSPVPLPRVQD